MDADAVLYSIQLLNAILRRLDSYAPVRQEFLEANGVDALEAVCDRASQDIAYGGGREWQSSGSDVSAADIVADLIGDLFANDQRI